MNLKNDNLGRAVDPYSLAWTAIEDKHPGTALTRDVVAPPLTEERGQAVADFAGDAPPIISCGRADRRRHLRFGEVGVPSHGLTIAP